MFAILTFMLFAYCPYDPTILDRRDEKRALKQRQTPWTIEQLNKYNGKINRSAYIGLCGLVYDVTDIKVFKSGGPYSIYAGHDISIAVAHHNMTDKYLDIEYDANNNSLTPE